MSLTLLGIVVLAFCLRFAGAPHRLVQIVMVAGIFEAAAAAIIGSLGVQPGLVPGIMLVGLVAMQYAGGRRSVAEGQIFHILSPLLLLLGYGAVTAIVLPDFFAGQIIVWPQKLDAMAPEPRPLAPGQGNINQVLYLFANVCIAFAAALAMGRAVTPWRALVRAYLLGGYIVVLLAFWQFAARTVGVPFPDDILYSNPGWAIVEQNLGNLPRLQGPFPEPSALAFYLSGVALACTALCLHGHRVLRPDLLLVLCILVVFLSTSTTGAAALAIGLPLVLLGAAVRGQGRLGRVTRVLALPAGALFVGALVLMVLRPEYMDVVADVIAASLGKTETESFIERSDMNQAAWDAFLASGGIGIGWGSTRASSMVAGLLAGAGVVGVVAALWCALRLRRAMRAARAYPGHPAAVALDAFYAAMAGQLLAAVISAPMITTPIFFAQLGVVVAATARVAVDARRQDASEARPAGAVLRGSAADEFQRATVQDSHSGRVGQRDEAVRDELREVATDRFG